VQRQEGDKQIVVGAGPGVVAMLPAAGGLEERGATVSSAETGGEEAVPLGRQGELFEDDRRMSVEAGGENGQPRQGIVNIDPEQAKATDRLLSLLREQVNEAAALRMGREELEGKVRGILVEFRGLVGTLHAEAVNNYLVRSAVLQCKVEWTREEVRRLWGGAVN
jgi:hypothetical protein